LIDAHELADDLQARGTAVEVGFDRVAAPLAQLTSGEIDDLVLFGAAHVRKIDLYHPASAERECERGASSIARSRSRCSHAAHFVRVAGGADPAHASSMGIRIELLLAACAGLLLPACRDRVEEHERMWESVHDAVAVLHPSSGSATTGVVWLRQRGDAVEVEAHVEGLIPESEHGFHVHEHGDCSAPDATSAGDHYNPGHHAHALPTTEPRHAGDLGNLQADDDGRAHFELTIDDVTVAGLQNPLVGRAVIVHAEPDDGGQPSGNAGARIACGVIGVAARE
jgi:Cu-Zn family superoxide dismutase